jgi:hypothetical protein
MQGANPHFHRHKDGSFHLSTPKTQVKDSEPVHRLLPHQHYISLVEVLSTVNRLTSFLDAFEPWYVKYARSRPPEKIFLAGIVGYGCFIGIGKIPKSDFILRIVDDVELRQAIEKQLNKGESGNKFSKAISFGNNHDFLYGEKVEQEIAEGCRRLIKNAIICWNYLYLSQKIAKEEDPERRQELITAVKNGSIAIWRHVNLHGEYDFSEEKMQDSVGLEMPPSLALNLF